MTKLTSQESSNKTHKHDNKLMKTIKEKKHPANVKILKKVIRMTFTYLVPYCVNKLETQNKN